MTHQARTQAEAGGDRSGGVTRRAVLVALFLLILLALLNFYVETAWGKSWTGGWTFASGCPAVVPVFVLFILASLMALPVLRRSGLRRRELLVVYSMVLVGSPVISHAVLTWMLVKNVAYYYGARVQPHWETMFLGHVPSWYAPSSTTAVEGFFEGRVPVPWAEWGMPLAAWSAFAIALFIATLSLMALLQRQWITHERLSFPVAQIPLEMVRSPAEAKRGSAGRLPIVWTFWIGFCIALGVNFLSSLSMKIPAVPSVPLAMYDLIPWQKVGPLAGLGAFTLILWPWMIALAYLAPKELSFSLWFFTIIRLLLTVGAIAAGATPQRPENFWDSSFPAPCYQGGGAVIALSLWTIWIARKHLGRAVRIGFSGRSRGEDAREPLGYLWAFVGFIVSSGFLIYFLWLANCRITLGLAVIFLTIGYSAIWARLRAETGLGFICFPIQIQDVVTMPFGNKAFRAAEHITLVTLRWVYTPGFSVSYEIFAESTLESFKIADSARINARRLAVAIIAAFLFAWVVGILVTLSGIYRYGWFGLAASRGGWLGPQSLGDGNGIVWRVTDPGEPDVRGVIGVLAGAAVTVILGLMRLRFWWWPFHPVGYLASTTWGAQWWYIPFFIGWVCKVLVVRYGGLRLYRTTVPFAIGMIVGDLLNGGLWAMAAVVSRGHI